MAVKPDWIIHYILDVCPSSHTHGLSGYGGLELELNLPVSQEKAMMILNLLGMEIAGKGKHYRSGDRESDVFLLPVYFFETAPAVPDAYFTGALRGRKERMPMASTRTPILSLIGFRSAVAGRTDSLSRQIAATFFRAT